MEPKTISRTAPPAARFEEDPNLAKGKRIQVEHAVGGATVEFTRIVSKDGVVIYDDKFRSNYRAWPAVYKIGTKE
jgi:hypothetical protein